MSVARDTLAEQCLVGGRHRQRRVGLDDQMKMLEEILRGRLIPFHFWIHELFTVLSHATASQGSCFDNDEVEE